MPYAFQNLDFLAELIKFCAGRLETVPCDLVTLIAVDGLIYDLISSLTQDAVELRYFKIFHGSNMRNAQMMFRSEYFCISAVRADLDNALRAVGGRCRFVPSNNRCSSVGQRPRSDDSRMSGGYVKGFGGRWI